MQEFDWRVVNNDEVFRRLCQSLLIREFPELSCYDAPGRDYGIDSLRSRECKSKTVFSFKRYGQFKDLIKVLRDDSRRIVGYQRSPSGSIANELWTGVDEIELMTNLPLSPQQELKIHKAFETTGLVVKVRNREYLEQLLTLYPSVWNRFVGSGQPLLLTREELLRTFPVDDRPKYSLDRPFVERSETLLLIEAALRDPSTRVLLLLSEGGLGKSRTVLELPRALPGFQFHFTNPLVAKLEGHVNEWLETTASVLIVDEAQDSLEILRETLRLDLDERQACPTRRFLLTCRHTMADQVQSMLNQLIGPREVRTIKLGRISDTSTLLIGKGHSDDEIRAIALMARGNPMWTERGSDALLAGVPLNELSRVSTVEHYIKVRLAESSHRRILENLAIVMPINIESDAQVIALGEGLSLSLSETRKIIAELVSVGLIQAAGRLRKLGPDAIADYLLRDQLLDANEYPTGKHLEILRTASPEVVSNVVKNIAKFEYGEGQGFFKSVFAELIEGAPSLNNGARLGVLQRLRPAAKVEPVLALRLAEALVSTRRESDEVVVKEFGSHIETVAHTDLFEDLVKFVRPALYRIEATYDAARFLEDLSIEEQSGRAENHAKGALTASFGFKAGLPLRLAKQMLEVVEARVSELLSQQGEDTHVRIGLYISAAQTFLLSKVDLSYSDVYSFSYRFGYLRLTPEVKEVRAKALTLLVSVSKHCDQRVRSLASNAIEDAWRDIHSRIGNTSHGEEDAVVELGFIQDAVEGIIINEQSFQVLDPLCQVVYWLLDYSSDKSAKAWAQRLHEVLLLKPHYKFMRSFFTNVWRKNEVGERKPQTLAKELTSIPEDGFVEFIMGCESNAGGRSANLPRALEIYCLDRPKRAHRILSTSLTSGTWDEAFWYVQSIFGAVRAMNGPSVLNEAAQVRAWKLAESYGSFYWWPEGFVPNSQEDQVFLDRAFVELAPESKDRLIPSLATVSDSEGEYFHNRILGLTKSHSSGKTWSKIISVLDEFRTYHPNASKLKLPEILLAASELEWFFDYEPYKAEKLLAEASNEDSALLPTFLSRRIKALLPQYKWNDLWPHAADWINEHLQIEDATRVNAIRAVFRECFEEDEPRGVDLLQSMIRDLSNSRDDLVREALTAELKANPSVTEIEIAASLAGGLEFEPETLDIFELLLDKAERLSASDRDSIRSRMHVAVGRYSISGYGESPVLVRRRQLAEARLADPTKVRFRALYDLLLRTTNHSIDYHRVHEEELEFETS